MSDLPLPSWICAVPLCRVTHTVEEALGALYQRQATQVVLTTQQDHAFAFLSLKDLLWGLAARILRLDQPLATVPLHQPLCLLLFTEPSPQQAWWTVWQRLASADLQAPALEYGFINLGGDFLGMLDYPRFLHKLVEYCPGNPLRGFEPSQVDSEPTHTNSSPASSPAASNPVTSSPLADLAQVFSQVLLKYGAIVLQEHHRLILENQHKGGLLDRLGHDLKTPLTSIVGLASLLKETSTLLPPPETPLDLAQLETIVQYAHRQKYYGEVIYQNSRYLMDLVNRLLALARLENHQQVLTPRSLPLQPLLQHCWSQAQQALGLRAPPHGSSSDRPCPDLDPTLQIWGDSECCEVLLTLFLTHRLDQETDSSRLCLTPSSWGEPPAWLILTLQPLQLQGSDDREFSELSPVSPVNQINPYKDDRGGEGSAALPDSLTLWLVRRFAHWQGGDLNSFGSTLALLLPQTPRPLESRQEPDPHFLLMGLGNAQEWLRVGSLRVLVDQLRSCGIFTLFATDPEELLAKWQSFHPATLLVDGAWAEAWESLALHRALEPSLFQQITLLAMVLPAVPQPEQQELAQDYFQFPQDGQRLWERLEQLRPSPNPAQPQAQSQTQSKGSNPSSGTVLWLGALSTEDRLASVFPGCQVLEAEDVEQAELLVQIWEIETIVIGWVPQAERETIVSRVRNSAFLAPLRLISVLDLPLSLLS